MKPHTKFIAAISIASISGPALATEITLVERTQAGASGKFSYTYNYQCDNGRKGTMTVISASDNDAKSLVSINAEENCSRE
jgi:hypothetical protein